MAKPAGCIVSAADGSVPLTGHRCRERWHGEFNTELAGAAGVTSAAAHIMQSLAGPMNGLQYRLCAAPGSSAVREAHPQQPPQSLAVHRAHSKGNASIGVQWCYHQRSTHTCPVDSHIHIGHRRGSARTEPGPAAGHVRAQFHRLQAHEPLRFRPSCSAAGQVWRIQPLTSPGGRDHGEGAYKPQVRPNRSCGYPL